MNTSTNSPVARFGHSCTLYKKSLIVFGGEYRSPQTSVKFKECLQDLHVFSLETKTWKLLICSGGPLQPRKAHAAAILGRNLLIQGGVNSKDQVLKDMWLLDLGNRQACRQERLLPLPSSQPHRCGVRLRQTVSRR